MVDRLRDTKGTPQSTISRFWRFSVNSLAQISGQLAPLVVAAVTIPVVYRHLGGSDFGIFTLSITAITFFSIMDFGIGRSTVRFISRAIARGDYAEGKQIATHAMLYLGALSLVLSALFAIAVPPIASQWLSNSGYASVRVTDVIYILAAAIPFIGMTSVFRSVLEAQEKFPTIAVIQGAMGALTYGLPLILSVYVPEIRIVVLGVVVARFLGFLAYGGCVRSFWFDGPRTNSLLSVNREFLRFTGWMMASNLMGNGLAYADRAVLVRFVPLNRLPFYNVPLEFLTRLMIVVNGAISVAFPFLSRISLRDVTLNKVHLVAMSALGVCMPPALLLCSIVAPVGLRIWLGNAFASQSTEIVRILLIGLMFLSFNAFALASLNARGVSRGVAVMQALEAPVYIWALWHFGLLYGMKGLAVVWTGRTIVEFTGFTFLQALETPRLLSYSAGMAIVLVESFPLVLLATVGWIALSLSACVALTIVSAFHLRSALRQSAVGAV